MNQGWAGLGQGNLVWFLQQVKASSTLKRDESSARSHMLGWCLRFPLSYPSLDFVLPTESHLKLYFMAPLLAEC